jgi:CPA1 family monovalent cation:H+ antiporter
LPLLLYSYRNDGSFCCQSFYSRIFSCFRISFGGIVSPPDAVSAGAILKFVKVQKRLSSILEGESLLNDASSLIIFRFAMIAVATGQFIWQDAVFSFSWMLIGGIGIGLIIGWLFMKGHKLLPTDANMDTILTIVAPI